MDTRAWSRFGYWNWNPSFWSCIDSTFCPSSTTRAPSPNSNLRIAPGTGKRLGRPRLLPRAAENFLIDTGFGATALTGPDQDLLVRACWIIWQRSVRCIQLIHWLPSPIGPPKPVLKTGSIFPRAPPSGPSTIPIRKTINLVDLDFSDAISSHCLQRRAKKSSPFLLSSLKWSFWLVP